MGAGKGLCIRGMSNGRNAGSHGHTQGICMHAHAHPDMGVFFRMGAAVWMGLGPEIWRVRPAFHPLLDACPFPSPSPSPSPPNSTLLQNRNNWSQPRDHRSRQERQVTASRQGRAAVQPPAGGHRCWGNGRRLCSRFCGAVSGRSVCYLRGHLPPSPRPALQ